jgi:hypothetical protein
MTLADNHKGLAEGVAADSSIIPCFVSCLSGTPQECVMRLSGLIGRRLTLFSVFQSLLAERLQLLRKMMQLQSRRHIHRILPELLRLGEQTSPRLKCTGDQRAEATDF